MYCSICGKKIDEIYVAEVEGAKLELCGLCAKYGKDIRKVEEPVIRKKKVVRAEPEVIYDLVSDYASKIRRARISEGLNPKDFASRINEKESVMKKIEVGKLKPSLRLAEKIERAFGVKLIEEQKTTGGSPGRYQETPATFGDIVDVKD